MFSLRPKYPIPCIAQTGEYVAVRIQLSIQDGGEDLNFGMGGGNPSHTLWRGNKTNKPYPAGAFAFQERNRRCTTPPRRQHRVKQEDELLVQCAGKL